MKGGKAGKAKAVTNKARAARLRARLRPALSAALTAAAAGVDTSRSARAGPTRGTRAAR